jgi:hypothetical protein
MPLRAMWKPLTPAATWPEARLSCRMSRSDAGLPHSFDSDTAHVIASKKRPVRRVGGAAETPGVNDLALADGLDLARLRRWPCYATLRFG